MALPSGYTKLDYIESSGTQYINTGFIPNGNSHIVMDCEPTSVDNTFGFFCARTATSATDTTANVLFYVDGKYRRDFYGTSKTTSGAYGAGKRITIDSNKNNVSIGTDYSLTFTASTNASPMALLLMATAVPGSTAGTFKNIANFAKMKLYSAKIYDNGTLVRDFIPCKNASGTIGLWDNVNSVFYANAGTGTFSTGTKHKTLIDGTGYEIKSGRVLIAGTGYDIKKGRTLIDGTGYDIKFATPIGELPAGTIVYMNVDGIRTPYIVVHQGNPDTSAYDTSCNGTWVLMQDIYSLTHWQNRQNTRYDEEDSCLVRQRAREFPSKLDTVIQNNLIPLKLLNIYSFQDISGDTVFLLRSEDLSNMDYFSNGAVSKRIATYNGAATDYWLRDPSSSGSSINYVTATGAFSKFNENSYVSTYKGKGFRPIYILNTSSLMADSDFNIIEP